jgi:predicted amidohydrolase
MKLSNITDQWHYYTQLILNQLEKQKEFTQQNLPTIITLPEYALGNVKKNRNHKDDTDYIKELISKFTKKYNVNLIGGSFAYKDTNGYKNRSLVWNNRGNNVASYDKKHLFNFEKKANFLPGTQAGLVQVQNDLKLKVLICSDLWFPEEVRLHLNDDINFVIVPAMSVVPEHNKIPYGRWLWHSLAITRARENVTPVIVSDWAVQNVKEGSTWTCGASSIIDPSVRWTNNEEYKQAFNHFDHGQVGILSSIIDLEKINEYKKYRKNVGLLPD